MIRHRSTCPIAIAHVNTSITHVIPNNDELAPPGPPPELLISIDDQDSVQENFITHDAITRSIHSMQLDSSLRIDGLPIEFYECLLKAENSPLAEWLRIQSVYIHSFNLGSLRLPLQMCQSQVGLLFKKVAKLDRLYPRNYRPIALLNVDFTILSCLLAGKLNPNLPLN